MIIDDGFDDKRSSEELRRLIFDKLKSFVDHYEQINSQIVDYCFKLESYSGIYQNKALSQSYSSIINSYRVKLQNIRVFILRVNEKINRLQCRINSIRVKLPKGHVYVETGPFLFCCVYKGGVRYRNFPSTAAAILKDKPFVECGDTVKITQRVFITAEESIFLVSKINLCGLYFFY